MHGNQARRHLVWGAALALLGLAGCRPPSGSGPAVDFDTTLADLTNVTAMVQGPHGRMVMASSYDRTGGNSDWARWTQPPPGGLVAVVDLQGPGCVRRLWMTSIRARRWHFFFDGEATARLSGTTDEIFGGRSPCLPPLCNLVSSGYYSYLPLPFARSLRIAIEPDGWDPNARQYYQVVHEVYPRGTPVTSFPATLAPEQQAHLVAVNEAWRHKDEALAAASAACASPQTFPLAPGTRHTWLEQSGPAQVVAFTVKLSCAPEVSILARERLLRELTLRVTWDGAPAPSINVPLGDFFGNAYHYRAFGALPLGRVNDTYICRLPMPFARSVKAELRNDGRTPVNVTTAVRMDSWPAGRSLRYLHATWNQSLSPKAPHTVLRANGAGHFVGCFLTAVSLDQEWKILEGDETIRVDGEEEPAWRGTGLEDYFNGGWYYTGLYDLPLQGLVEKAPIRTDQYRFHVPDKVPFERQFDMSFEFGEANASQGYLSSVAYWYQTTPAAAGTQLDTPGAPRVPPADPMEKPAIMAHLFELDRIDHHAEARERCLAYIERFPKSHLNPLLQLRALAYREKLEGFEAVEADYAALAARQDKSPVALQAETLLWFGRHADGVLIGAHINAQYRLYLDGRYLGHGNSDIEMAVFPSQIQPGPHEVTLEVTPVLPIPWVSVHVRTHKLDFHTDATWECARSKPATWPRAAGDTSVAWAPAVRHGGDGLLPRMSHWEFLPNGYVDMQAASQLYYGWRGWDRPQGMTTYFRKTFVVE